MLSRPDKSRLWQLLQRCLRDQCRGRAAMRAGIAGVGRRLGGGSLAMKIGEGAQVVVGEGLGHLVHDLDVALLFAEQIKLDQRVGRGLSAERGNFRIFRLAVAAVAGRGTGAARSAIVSAASGWPSGANERRRRRAGRDATNSRAMGLTSRIKTPGTPLRSRPFAFPSAAGGAGVAVGDAIDGAVPVVGDEKRAVLHHRDIDRAAEIGIAGDEAGEERLRRSAPCRRG